MLEAAASSNREGERSYWKAALAAASALTLLVAACFLSYDPRAVAMMSEARVRHPLCVSGFSWNDDAK